MQLASMYFNNSDQKIADILSRLYTQLKTSDCADIISIPLTHQEIADLVGCSRITITRSLDKLKSQDIIDMKNKKIIIKNISKLNDYIKSISK